MEQHQRCLNCQAVMSFIGNDPCPVILSCNHNVCLNCVNTKGEWSPQQPHKECQYECPVQTCGASSKLNLNDVNQQLNNVRQRMQEQLRIQGQGYQILFKCSAHSKKPIEFRCNRCKEILCSLCMFKHSGHSDEVEIFTEDEIVQESDYLISLNKSVVQKLTQNQEQLEQISAKQTEISSEQIQQAFVKAAISLTSTCIEDQDKILDIQEKYLENARIIDSKILGSKPYKREFFSLFEKKDKFNLLWRGSDHGFTSQIFIQRCCNKGKTITIVKDTTGKIFGGFSDVAFDGKGTWLSDRQKKCFLFAFQDDKIVKCICINNQYEVFTGSPQYLVYFGHQTLGITDNFHTQASNMCNDELGKYYDQSTLRNKRLAGQQNFQVQDIEIFQVID